MPIDTIKESLRWFEIMGAIFISSLLQYAYSNVKGRVAMLTIVGSSFFVGLYIVRPLIHYLELDINSPLVPAMYAIGSLISVTIISLIISKLPTALKNLVLNKMGVKDEDAK
jgi:hypothetical protein